MNKTWLLLMAIIAAALLIFPYLGFGTKVMDTNNTYSDTPAVQAEKPAPAGTDKNKLSDIEDILNN